MIKNLAYFGVIVKEISVETIAGVVDAITFKSDDNSFSVFRLRPELTGTTITVVGNMAYPLLGEDVEVTGDWVEHRRFGKQFKAVSCRRIPPTTEKGIQRYLASGVITGIGTTMAERLVKHFGSHTLEIMELHPHRLTEVEGIGKKKAKMIAQSYTAQGELREIMVFLEFCGLSGSLGPKVVSLFGASALDIIKENPYRLASEVEGIGFRKADQVAMSLGLEKTHHDRIFAGILYTLTTVSQSGHCCVPEEVINAEAAQLLQVDTLAVADAVRDMISDNALLTETFQGMELIYPPWLHDAEKFTASRLLEIRDCALPIEEGDYRRSVKQWEQAEKVTLAEEQRQAVISALSHGVLVLTGGPGTGKTTTIRGIIALLEAQGCQILLGAPTGRAAKRLSEATGRPAATLHRLLEAAGGKEGAPLFMRNESNPLEADVVIVDEASMMDISITSNLLKAIPDGCRLILVGDIDQLPAVGPGSVLKDIIRSRSVPVVRLTEVFRQSGESIIIHNAHRINKGLPPDLNTTGDFLFIEILDSQEAANKVVTLCVTELPQQGFDPIEDIQVLSPMHRHDCGVENLNQKLQAALNPSHPMKDEIKATNVTFRTGDKVMQMKNNYTKSVFNGDIGVITAIDSGLIYVRYPDSAAVYDKQEIGELHLAYAMSVHKSQGSEYPIVILPVTAAHRVMLQRNLLYTAVTRAKERVILVGTKEALAAALANDRTKRRYTLLAERLRGDDLW